MALSVGNNIEWTQEKKENIVHERSDTLTESFPSSLTTSMSTLLPLSSQKPLWLLLLDGSVTLGSLGLSIPLSQ